MIKFNHFNFRYLQDQVLLTNDLGRHVIISKSEFKDVVRGKVNDNSELGRQLIAQNMAYCTSDLEYTHDLRQRIRDTKSHLYTATSLHIFVVTTRCNLNCVYCQANNGRIRPHLSMDTETAEHAVDIALSSPATSLDFEFQGGEPLLNFPVIRHIVEYAEARKKDHVIRYNIVTNLTLLSDEIVNFFSQYHFGVSTSIDGAETLHNANRPYLDGSGSFASVKSALPLLRNAGISVGAIETTTRNSLTKPRELVHAYVDLGFDSIFLRPLTPLGKASLYWSSIGYSPEEYVAFHKQALDEVFLVNRSGQFLKETHVSILLQRMNGKKINYMELRSPCGAGIGQIAYYPDGRVFTCDESRMLFEMGDDAFCIGNVYENSYHEIIQSGICKAVCTASILESIPGCCDCAYQPYCGTCPVVNYARTGDLYEKSPNTYRCKIYSGLLDYLFKILMNPDSPDYTVIQSWSNE